MPGTKTKSVSYSEPNKKATEEYIDDELLAEKKRREESLKKAALKEKLRRKAKGGKIDKEKLRNKVNKIKRQQEVVKRLQSKPKEQSIPPIRRSKIVEQNNVVDRALERPKVTQTFPETSRHSSGTSRTSSVSKLPDVSRRHSVPPPPQHLTRKSPDIKRRLQTKKELPSSASSKVKPSDSKPRKKGLFGSIRSLFGSERSDSSKDLLPKTKPLPPIIKKDSEEADILSNSSSDNLEQKVIQNDSDYLASVASLKAESVQETDIPQTSNNFDLEQKTTVIDTSNSSVSKLSVESTTEIPHKSEILETTDDLDLAKKSSATSERLKSKTSNIPKLMCEIGIQTEELWESEDEESLTSDSDVDSTTQDIEQVKDGKFGGSKDFNDEHADATMSKTASGLAKSHSLSDILRKASIYDGDPIEEGIPDRLGSASRRKGLKKLKGTLKKHFAGNETTHMDWLRLIHAGFGKDDEFEVDPKLEIKIWDLDPDKDYDKYLNILMEELERENEYSKYKLKRVKQDTEYLIKEEEYMEQKKKEQIQQDEDMLLSYEEQQQADYYREKREKAERLRKFMKKFPIDHRDPKKTPEIESSAPSTPGFGDFDENYVYNFKKKTIDFQVQGATKKFKESAVALEEAKQLMLDAMHSGFEN